MNIKDVIFDFMRENKSTIMAYLFFSFATPISAVYLPHLYGKIIELINKKGTVDRQVQIRFASIFVLWIIVQFLWAAMNRLDAYFIPKLRSHIRKYIVQKIISTYKEDYSEQELGGLLAEIVRLPDEINHMFYSIRNHILPMAYMLTFSIGYFTWINSRLGIASIFTISLYLWTVIEYSKKCITAWSEMNTEHDILHGEINDCLGNLLNIYIANKDSDELERLDKYEQRFFSKHSATINCTGRFRLLMNISYIVLFCTLNIVSFYLFSRKLIQLSDVVTTLIISLELISKMSSFVGSIDQIMYGISTIQNVQKRLDSLQNKFSSKNIGIQTPSLNGNIIIKNLCIKYNHKNVIKNFNLDIPKGSTTVLTGPIGTGKTSIINALIRLIPYEGQIIINGNDIKDIDIGHLRTNVLYVPQNPRLFNRSIYENIIYQTKHDKNTVLNILKKYGLNIDIDKIAGKNGGHLSGGQRQIIYLLRAIFNNTPIVLLDEPTSSLDKGIKHYILNILRDLCQDRTVIIISHDPDVLNFSTNTIRL